MMMMKDILPLSLIIISAVAATFVEVSNKSRVHIIWQRTPHNFGCQILRRKGKNDCKTFNLQLQATTEDLSADLINIDKEGSTDRDDDRLWYQRADGMWRPRMEVSQLKVGQRLFATKLDDKYDLLSGRTGPKLFYECGVGRFTNIVETESGSKGKKVRVMRPVHGMLRLGGHKMKESVAEKKRARLTKKQKGVAGMLPVWVTKVDASAARFEVSVSEEEALILKKNKRQGKVSASILQAGQERTGTVVDVKPYGVFVDVGVSRLGLLHIQTVADFFGTFVNKEKGLKECGLEMGANIKVSVQSNERKRLALDFPEEAKKNRALELEQEAKAINLTDESKEVGKVSEDDEAMMWAQYAAAPGYDDDSDGDDDDDDDDFTEYSVYDEDRDIESSLGLDFY